MKESSHSGSEDDHREFLIQHKFTTFTQWELDTAPGEDNPTQKMIDWVNLSSAVSFIFMFIVL